MNDRDRRVDKRPTRADDAPEHAAVVDQITAHNRQCACAPPSPGSPRPARRLVIVTCMDTRLDPYKALGLAAGDAHIIRNAGGIVTEDVLRSLVVSSHILGTRELMVINHTDCGLLNLCEHHLVDDLERATGRAAVSPAAFFSFTDLEANVRRQIGRVRDHPWLSQLHPRGFVYDVSTGKLREVNAAG